MSLGFGRIGSISTQLELFSRLQQIDRDQARIDRQMATGLREGPASFRVIGNWLRFDKGGIRMARDNIADGLDFLGAAGTQLQEVIDIFGEARELAIRGHSDTLSAEDREQLGLEINALLLAADGIIKHAKFNETPLLDGRTLDLAIGPEGKCRDTYSLRLPCVDLEKLALSPSTTEPTCDPGSPGALAPCGSGAASAQTGYSISSFAPGGNQASVAQASGASAAGKGGPAAAQTPASGATLAGDQSVASSSSWAGGGVASNPQVGFGGNGQMLVPKILIHQFPWPPAGGGSCPPPPPAPPPDPAPAPPPDPAPDPPGGPPGGASAFKEFTNRLDHALKFLGKSVIRMSGDRAFLNARLRILDDQLARTESMRSRFEDADLGQLQIQSAKNDIYRQTALTSLARQQANQQALVAAFLGLR